MPIQEILNEETMCSVNRIKHPEIYGLQILNLAATNMKNYTMPPLAPGYGEEIHSLNFCNVTVTYTHPGWDDAIRVIIYLPTEGWNGRFQASGGGGYVTGGEALASFDMGPGLRDGYTVATTDGGHTDEISAFRDASSWILSSPGNVNWPLLVDFAYVALHDMATIGKAITEAYYGTPPQHSYFHGSSTGGKQAITLAQKYPTDFDGIVAGCPAINWPKFTMSGYWPHFVMNQLGAYPRDCEMRAITAAAIAACDELDGVADGIISLPALCNFDPHTLVGKAFHCGDTPTVFTSLAADIAEAAWTGPRSSTGEFQWYGIGKDAEFGTNGMGIASTTCDEDGTCTAIPFTMQTHWIKFFLKKDPDFDPATIISHEEWDALFRASVDEYQSMLGTANPDLTEFHRAGGKMISWHGLRDPLIPVNGSVNYYDRVMERDPEAQEYFRLFLVPGAGHSPADGPTPKGLRNVIVDWVEEGIAPDTLRGIGADGHGKKIERDVCMYPRVQVYVSGDTAVPSSFACVEG